MIPQRLTPEAALQALASEPLGMRFLQVFQHGTLQVEIYKPVSRDLQRVHSRDEIYVVIAGHGEFVSPDRCHAVGPGELLFAAAGVEHYFENFSDDFCTWVVFYGPEGGETG